MDQYSGKKGAGGLVTQRKGCTSFKDAATEEDPNAQFCNRVGCQGRIKYGQKAKPGNSDKAKFSKSSSRTLNGYELTGKSVRNGSVITSAKNSNFDSKRKLCSPSKTDPSESSVSGESEAPEFMTAPVSLTDHPSGSSKSGEVSGTETGSSSASSNVRAQRVFHPKSSLQNQNSQPASVVPLASKSSQGLRNTRCNLVSTNIPARCLSLESESESVGNKNKMKRRSSEGDSSFSRRVSKTNVASHVSTSTSNVFISETNRCSNSSGENNNRTAPALPQRSRNENARLPSRQNGRNRLSVRQPADGVSHVPNKGMPPRFNIGGCSSSYSSRSTFAGDESSNAASDRNRRSMNDNNRQLPARQNGRNNLSIRQPGVGNAQVPGIEIPFSIGSQNSVRLFSGSDSRSYGLPSSNSDNPSTTIPREYLYRYNIEGIAEVLLALERVEQEELTHEQVLALETSLFLSSLNIYDQHRDMRMDIDNMSYEELLALEERMGTVSTALPEEALLNCLKKSIYEPTPSKPQTLKTSCEDGDDIKCSICQEEYIVGEEIGKLVGCQHGYHVTCINQWLQMKNWCPICKASAAPSQPS